MPTAAVAPDTTTETRTESYRSSVDNKLATVSPETDETIPAAESMAATGPVAIVREESQMTEIKDLSGFEGSTVEAKLKALTDSHPIVVFSKSHCPFCIEVKKTFNNLNVPIHYLEVNQSKDGPAITKSLKATTKHTTVPNVFIKGKHVGGCDDVKRMQSDGSLESLIGDLVIRSEAGNRGRGEAIQPLFWFPNVVNNRVVRFTGTQVFFCCIVAIIFREDEWTKWFVTGLMLDFIARMVLGSYASPLGMIATVLASPFTPIFKPGPPKQFAAFCGVCFTLPAMALLHSGQDIAASVILGLLMGASGLEGFFNFCLGCVFFGLGIRFKLISPAVYRIYANTKDSVINGWHWANVEAAKATAPKEVVREAGSNGVQTKADLKYKRVKTDEYIVSDFHLIRNMQNTYFSMPLGLAGLAVAYKLASPWLNDFITATTGVAREDHVDSYNLQDDVWRTLAVMAAVVYLIMILLYTARLFMYHKKCVKEWHCPMRSPAFGTITITCTLLGFLAYDQFETRHFGRGLVWMGAVSHAVLTITKFGEWIGKRYELEHVHPSWLILPVGGFVQALVIPIVPAIVEDGGARETALGMDQNIEFANFFFGFAYFMWIALFAITFFKAVTTHNSDDRLRSQIFIWIAPPAIGSVADFIICFSRASISTNVGVEQCAQNFSQLYWIAIMLELGLFWAAMPYINFFFRNPFNMSYWNFVFSLDAVAAASAMFFGLTSYKIAEILFVVSFAVATTANFLAFMHTITALVRRRGIFTPEKKWGPLSFMKLVHEACRGAMPKMKRCVEQLDPANRDTVMELATEFEKFAVLHHEHAAHEDQVIFREFERFFPDHCKEWLDDHEEDRVFLAEVKQKLDVLVTFTGDAAAGSEAELKAAQDFLQTKLPPFFEHFAKHLLGEEENVNPIGRKHVPLAVQKALVTRVWDLTPAKNWAIIIPFVLENLPRLPQRTLFVKALLWGLGGERAQHVGAIIYKNCDAVMWEVLIENVPEIIPRGVPGWRRYY